MAMMHIKLRRCKNIANAEELYIEICMNYKKINKSGSFPKKRKRIWEELRKGQESKYNVQKFKTIK